MIERCMDTEHTESTRFAVIQALIAGLFFSELLGLFGVYALDVQTLAWAGLLATSGFVWVLYAGVVSIERRDKVATLPVSPFVFAIGVLYLDAMGNVSHWYDLYPWFDELMHILGGAAIASVGFAIGRGSPYWEKGTGVQHIIDFSVIGLVAIIGIAFEGVEFAVDELFDQQFWLGDATDTLSDLSLNIAGAITIVTLLFVAKRRRVGYFIPYLNALYRALHVNAIYTHVFFRKKPTESQR